MDREHTGGAGDRTEVPQDRVGEEGWTAWTEEDPRPRTGVVHQISRSQGGVPKLPVSCARVTRDGLEGDRQANLKFHGGPERALCLFALERIEELRAEGHPIGPGTTGENITTEGLEWASLAPGAVLRIGAEVEIEIASYTAPCKNIAGSFRDGRFVRISQKVRPGDSRLYARVLRGGRICVGDPIRVRPPRGSDVEPARS